MRKLLSIIIPVYNAETTVERTLNSIFKQNTDEVEVICINDGSNDNSLSILQNEKQKNSCMKLINQKNSGVAAARNTGMREAKGEYLLFVDADDWLCKDALNIILKNIKKENFDMLVFGSIYINGKRNRAVKPAKKVELSGKAVRKKELELMECEYFNAVWNKVYKRKITIDFGLEFNENIYYGEDCCFNLLFLSKINSYMEIPICLYYYKANMSTSVTKKYDYNRLNKMLVFFNYQSHLLESNMDLEKELIEAKKRSLAVHYSFSSFIELFRTECQLTRKEKKIFIAKTLGAFNVDFTFKDNKMLTWHRKVLNTIICSKHLWLIYFTSHLFYFIKKNSGYKSMY